MNNKFKLMSTSLLAMVGAVAPFALAHADNVPFEFGAYARSSMHAGEGLRQGENLRVGSAPFQNRLQEGQYLELTTKAHPVKDSLFQFTMASGDAGFHYTDTWKSDFAIRELFFKDDTFLGAKGNNIWFGQRLYRGADMNLFDSWVLDNQNILGGGIELKNEGKGSHEFALGVKKDSLTGPADTNGQRYMAIHKIHTPMGDNWLNTNIELQYTTKATRTVSETILTAPAGGGVVVPSTVTTTTATGSSYGVMAGGQLSLTGGHNVFVNAAYNDVKGGINTAATNNEAQKGSWAVQTAYANTFECAHGNMIVNAIAKYSKPKVGDVIIPLSAAARHMFPLSERVQVGAELDYVTYAKGASATDVSYLQVAPMAFYQLGKGAYGVPRLKLIAANTFYGADVQKYGKATKHAFDVSAGFELWF